MAEIYDYEEGYEITVGLQGSKICNEASDTAFDIAKNFNKSVLLVDDDGYFEITPDGTCRELENSEVLSRGWGTKLDLAKRGLLTIYTISRKGYSDNWIWCGDGDTDDGTTADLPDEVLEFAEFETGDIEVDGETYRVEIILTVQSSLLPKSGTFTEGSK